MTFALGLKQRSLPYFPWGNLSSINSTLNDDSPSRSAVLVLSKCPSLTRTHFAKKFCGLSCMFWRKNRGEGTRTADFLVKTSGSWRTVIGIGCVVDTECACVSIYRRHGCRLVNFARTTQFPNFRNHHVADQKVLLAPN